MISFTTSLLISYGNYSIVFILYSVVLTITGALLSLVWFHAQVTNNIDKALDHNDLKNMALEIIFPPILFMLSISVL